VDKGGANNNCENLEIKYLKEILEDIKVIKRCK
jgi:hypothetical protein